MNENIPNFGRGVQKVLSWDQTKFFIFRAESETIFNGLRHIKFKDFE